VNVVEIEQLGKRYRLGGRSARYLTLREALVSAVRRHGSTHQDAAEIWALRDVSLAVEDGDVVGVVGRNGAGKTTLLKVVAGITEPSTGVVRTRGRLGTLLDVGTGLHPELSGRENIYLNGAILGMSRRDISRRFDEIVAFAGVEDFLDTPLKRYSTGMYLRLAFAVAAHLEPDIVLVDEVLAVGDAEFQRRCLGKMSQFGDEGRTVIFVSHDMSAVGQLCRRGIWLDSGAVRADGAAADVIDRYLRSRRTPVPRADGPSGSWQAVQLLSAELVDGEGEPLIAPNRDDPFSVRLRFVTRERVLALDLAVYLVNRHGARVIDDAWLDTRGAIESADDPGEYEASAHVPPVLAPGDYLVGVWIGTEHETFFDRDVLSFEVLPRPNDRPQSVNRSRVVQPKIRWTVRRRSRLTER
jgi:ABC-type polysaccharide/polyol phosphate transport system ATPase subunit